MTFKYSTSKFDFKYEESPINSAIESRAILAIKPFLVTEKVNNAKSIPITIWFDQLRIAKVIFIEIDAKIFTYIQPRLEFIYNYSFKDLISQLPTFARDVFKRDTIEYIYICYYDTTQANAILPIYAKNPSIKWKLINQ